MSDFILRDPRPGDIGWVIQRHGEIYSEEYGWDWRFEGLVADICAKFIENFDDTREKCWIAERERERLGCVFLVKNTVDIAQLRMLLVDPSARGSGLGRRLVDECIVFARSCGYSKMQLWTNDVLVSARRIYEAAGFRLIEEEEHSSWGKRLTSQTWEMTL